MKKIILIFLVLSILSSSVYAQWSSGAFGQFRDFFRRINLTVKPSADDSYDLGSSSLEWKDAYFDGTVNADGIDVGSGPLTTTGTVTAEQLTSTDDATITDDLSVGGDLTVTGTTTSTNIADYTATGNITMTNDAWIGSGAAADRIIFNDTNGIGLMNTSVGIGTTGPSEPLHIYGTDTETNMVIQNNIASGAGYPTLRIVSKSDGYGQVIFGDTLSNHPGAIYYSHAVDRMTFTTNNINQMVLDRSGNLQMDGTLSVDGTGDSYIQGNVGIGTTGPGYPLDVNGDAIVRDVLYLEDGSYYIIGVGNSLALRAPTDISFRPAGVTNAAFSSSGLGVNVIRDYSGGNLVLQDDNGNVGIGTTGPDTGLDLSGTLSYTPSTTQVIDAVGDAISDDAALVILNPDGDYTLTSTPTVTDGVTGQILYITCDNAEANTVTVQDEETLASSGLELGATTRAISGKDVLVLLYNGSQWVEVSFANN